MDIGRINDANIAKHSKKPSGRKKKDDISTQKDMVTLSGKPEKEITFLNYLDGSNNLEPYIMQNLKDMEQVGTTDNMNIVAQLSRFQVPPLTKYFFGEAVKQVITNEKFGEMLTQETGNAQAVAEFQEMFKNPSTAGYIAENILESSPPLMQGMTELATNLTSQVLGDKDMVNMVTTVAYQLAQQMLEPAKDEAKGIALGSDNSQQKEIGRLSQHMMNAIKNFVQKNMVEGKVIYADKPYTGGSLLKSSAKDFVPNNEPEWIGARRYVVTKGDDPSKINSKVVEDMGFVNMGEPETLTDFLVWGIKNFPAKKYVVLASDHGAGMLGGFEDRGTMMTMPQISQALAEAEKQTGVKPEVLIFDACLMAQAEVAYELKDRANVLIASEETVGGMGMPYIPILNNMNQLAEQGKADGKNLSKAIIDECAKTSEKSTTTFSAIDLTKMDGVKASVDNLAQALLKTDTPDKTIKFLIQNTTPYSQTSPSAPYRDYRDLGHLADNIIESRDVNDPKLKEAAKELKKSLSETVIAEEHIKSDEEYAPSQGMSIYAPKSDKHVSQGIYKKYKDTAMSKDGMWDEFLEKLGDLGKLLEEKEGEKSLKPIIVELPNRH